MAGSKKLPDYIVTERVKAEAKPYAGEVYEERIKAGSPESDDALRAASGALTEEPAPAKKSASAKK
jgi:hypothetical protein